MERFLLVQNGQTNNVIDNIHSIVAAAAVKFDQQQLEHLFLLIQKVRLSITAWGKGCRVRELVWFGG